MATSGKTTDKVLQRVMELLAHGKGAQTIGKTLQAERLVDSISNPAVHYQIKRIAADPLLMRQLEIMRRSAMLEQMSALQEIAWDVLTKIRNVINKVNTNEDAPFDPLAIAVLERLSPQLEKWWKNLSQVTGLLKEQTTTVNLTQVNIEQVNVVNSALLSVIQDMMRLLPTEKQKLFMERIREMGTTDGDKSTYDTSMREVQETVPRVDEESVLPELQGVAEQGEQQEEGGEEE